MSQIIKKIIVLGVHIFLWSLNSLAASNGLCSGVFFSDTELLNQQILKRYPQLKFVVENPDRFVAEMRKRFEEQKNITPENPYGFDYSEIGIPLMRDLKKDLDLWGIELEQKLSVLPHKNNMHSLREAKEIIILIEHSKAMLQEASEYLVANRISYKEVIEYSYFYTRMRGALQAKNQTTLLSFYLFIDRTILNGHRPKSAAQEFELYKNRKFAVFTAKGFSPGFRQAAGPFEKALFNQEKFDTVWIPSNAPLGPSIFMRLLSRDINLIGVTHEPILADGILRPSSDFWIHDVRHESLKFFLHKEYKLKNEITLEQSELLSEKIDKWLVEINSSVDKVENKELRSAIKLLIFSFHHDRGFPLIPSVYLTPNKKVLIASVLYMMQKTAGEKVNFKNPIKNLRAADKWLNKFWLDRLEEERSFLENLN